MSAKREILAAASITALLALAASPAAASITHPKPRSIDVVRPATPDKPFKAAPKIGGTWTPLATHFPGGSPDTPLLLTDGTVIVHDGCTANWFKLTPDNTGSYVNGTWSQTAALPKGYAPLYFASQVLADGRVAMNGGEYNGTGCQSNWTNKGAIYDPVADKWTAVAVPKTVKNIGDAQSIVLPDGGYMLANSLTTQEMIATFDASGTPTWTMTGSGKKDRNDEEGWNYIPGATILTVDATRNAAGPINKTELYDIASGTWSDGHDTVNQLVDPTGSEIGPAVLIPGGPLFQVGGTPCGDSTCQGHTATYDPVSGNWTAGPDIPKIKKDLGDASDGPAALLPNGNILVQTSPKFVAPSHFFEFNGTTLTRVSEPADAPIMSSFEGRMLELPTGQIFWTSGEGDIEVYTTPYATNPAWAPTIGNAPKKVARGHANYSISGVQFNGLTQGSGYGDDSQSYTNYPIVRITNKASGHVCYARTHDHSTMGINDPGQDTSTKFDVPNSCEAGASTIEVVANGMASPKVNVTVN